MINIMSKKKRDSMLSSASGGSNPAPGLPPTGASIILSAFTGTNNLLEGTHSLIYSPSQRQLTPSNATFTAQRTSSRPYYKGISEVYTFAPNDNSVWWHRRIVFSTKRRYAEENDTTANSGVLAPAVSGTGITRRKYQDMSSSDGTDGFNEIQLAVLTDLFVGAYDIDWRDPMRAKLDRTRVSVHSDRLTTLKSANDVPAPRITKHYTVLNKTIVHADEENGQVMQSNPYAVQSKQGMGNVYVLDFFECPVPNDTTTTTLNVSSQSTVYWHEK